MNEGENQFSQFFVHASKFPAPVDVCMMLFAAHVALNFDSNEDEVKVVSAFEVHLPADMEAVGLNNAEAGDECRVGIVQFGSRDVQIGMCA